MFLPWYLPNCSTTLFATLRLIQKWLHQFMRALSYFDFKYDIVVMFIFLASSAISIWLVSCRRSQTRNDEPNCDRFYRVLSTAITVSWREDSIAFLPILCSSNIIDIVWIIRAIVGQDNFECIYFLFNCSNSSANLVCIFNDISKWITKAILLTWWQHRSSSFAV